MKKYKAWAFESIHEKGRYLADGIDCMDFEHERGDVKDLEDAHLVIRSDLSHPSVFGLAHYIRVMRKLESVIDWDGCVEPNYTPKLVEVNEDQLKIIRERNEW